uniref:Uncharacterized protein n=1 Tax=Anopheles dirus TaxID=7168 RepID=A0A182MZH6_9DIPT
MPKQPKDFDFRVTVEKLKKLFGDQPHEEYGAYACRVNKKVVEAKLAGIAEEEIKCMLFVRVMRMLMFEFGCSIRWKTTTKLL